MTELHYLAERSGHIPTLAAWHYAQWGELNPANDVAARIARLQTHLQQQAIPTTFVACDGEELLGSAALVASDLDIRPELTPWLASVFVAPAVRQRGVGTLLVQRVMQEARTLGVPRLYLFTLDREKFYASLGWRLMERAIYRDKEIAIMAFEFQ
ncbi:GNAT family N-acetyltransferase [Anatilimnocola floriformis]|uniref:GNAT family N-acetyltransferase n=1 Tax=Anatilimnocola floriformis TaxID=2948575 RepID=UPI0020C374DB|nr:GNAT family N-acetyltransferase [Anatilimnocola floriformis]